MRVKCRHCGKEDIGRKHKLIDRGWLILFLKDGIKIERCNFCKPILWNRRKKFKIFITDLNEEITDKKNKVKIIKALQ